MTSAQFLHHIARKGAALGSCGRMCNDCAFKKMPKNETDPAIEHITSAIAAGVTQMNCHTADYQDAGTPCVGFQYFKQYFDHLEKN